MKISTVSNDKLFEYHHLGQSLWAADQEVILSIGFKIDYLGKQYKLCACL
jgi:hypothetical protein